MAFSFEAEPELHGKLEWIEAFVEERIKPLGHLRSHSYEVHKAAVAKQHLKACRNVRDSFYFDYSLPNRRAEAMAMDPDPVDELAKAAEVAG